MESVVTEEQSLETQVSTLLADLAHANHSPQTRRAYASDFAQLCAFHQGPMQTITAEVLQDACPSSSSHQSTQVGIRTRPKSSMVESVYRPFGSDCGIRICKRRYAMSNKLMETLMQKYERGDYSSSSIPHGHETRDTSKCFSRRV